MPDTKNLTVIHTNEAPQPAGHYSQAIVAQGLVFVSGQLPIAVDGTPSSGLNFEDQSRLALNNMLAILRGAGCGAGDLVRVTAYIVGADNWPRFNSVYAEVLGSVWPARTVVPVQDLHYGCLIELDAIAVRPDLTSGPAWMSPHS